MTVEGADAAAGATAGGGAALGCGLAAGLAGRAGRGTVGGLALVVAAAGRGRRFGAGTPKQYAVLGGRPLLGHTLAALEAASLVEAVVVVVNAEDISACRTEVLGDRFAKVKAVVAGGAERPLSVRAGLEALAALSDAPYLGVHDGARPLVDAALIERLVAALEADEGLSGVVPGLAPSDTVKRVDAAGMVVGTPDRAGLRLVQTPQVFRRAALLEAYVAAETVLREATDDASLVERAGGRVATVEGSWANIKVTHPRDATLVEWLAVARPAGGSEAGTVAAQSTGELEAGTVAAHATRAPELRVGLGVDAHRFTAERALVLGGVRIREDHGLAGHSDADVVVHAVMDALLGAAGLEDIGHHFPDTDPAFAGADSLRLLERVGHMLAEAGYRVANLDCVVICQEPRIAPHREAMRRRMAETLAVAIERVGVRGTTTEGMGFTGRGEGIAAQAVVLLERRVE